MKTRVHLYVGVLWLCSLLGGSAAYGSRPASPIAATSAELTARPASEAGEVTGVPPMESSNSPEPRVDLLGNEIEDAVADYRVDLGGDVYERHSPETALLRLGSPSS